MTDPHRWLYIIRRGERIVSCAFAVTMFWLYLWYEFWPEREGRVQAIAHMFILALLGSAMGITAWCWKTYLLELIEDRKSEEGWKEMREGRWPSG